MKKIVLLFVGVVFLAVLSKAQGVEDELGFKYVKAKYLMETERYEDAIKAFTEIINKDSDYEEALLYRAEAKYAMAAYRGTKKDVLQFVENNGITEKALVLLGKSDYKLKNNEAALNTLLIATGVVISDAQVFEYVGNLYQEDGKLLKACGFWAEGADMGSSKCESKSRKVCGSTRPEKNKDTSKKEEEKSNDGGLGKSKNDDTLGSGKNKVVKIDIKGKEKDEDDTSDSKDDDSLNNEPRDNSEDVVDNDEAEDDAKDTQTGNFPPDDDTSNDIVIDDELTISIFGNALGKREVLDQPDMLIISESDGDVAIDICVNKRGKVESAELNEDLTTISKQSLISVALRKAKDFWFEKNDYKEQCGVMVFSIIGN